jgi:hypothetical protein
LVVPSDSLAAMARAVERSKRETNVRFPIEYIRRGDDVDPMVAQLLRGGRGGEVRLKVHMTLAMQATKAPFTVTRRPSVTMAKVLNLDGETGGRRVTESLRWLEDHKLIEPSEPKNGLRQLKMLDPTGSGGAWGPNGKRYLAVPLTLWSSGWIMQMSGRSLAVFLALTELNGGSLNPLGEVMDGWRKRQYGLSDDTWTRAIGELEGLGLLSAESEVFGDDDRQRRRRKRYLPSKLPPHQRPTWI